ncbi:MAG: pyridoxal-phosphate dependent enzyme [Blastocatellia bacterium]|nr:pyridoxal-phosphate dependent enzyme [Blastocatellia bacterium]
MRKRVFHVCSGCGATFPHAFTTFCDRCGAMIDVEYDLDRVVLHDSEDALVRYFDLLPLESDGHLVSYGGGPTPCRHAERLGGELGLPWLFIKDETVLPTGSTKDRMAAVVLSFLRECGIAEFCTSSTGNSSTALANLIGQCSGTRMYLFSGDEFQHRVNFGESEQVVHFVMRGATFVEAFEYAAEFARQRGIVSERGFFNPARREGLKLAFLEAVEQVPRPIDWYVQAVSSAMGVYGTYKGARELVALRRIARPPRLLCVQQETCSPMARAFEDGSEAILPHHIVPRPHGIASAILRGNPSRVYPIVRRIVIESEGGFATVSETEIREARRMAEELEGLSLCFSSAAALAGMAKLARRGGIAANQTVLVNLTGRDRDAAVQCHSASWLRRSGDTWIQEGD